MKCCFSALCGTVVASFVISSSFTDAATYQSLDWTNQIQVTATYTPWAMYPQNGGTVVRWGFNYTFKNISGGDLKDVKFIAYGMLASYTVGGKDYPVEYTYDPVNHWFVSTNPDLHSPYNGSPGLEAWLGSTNLQFDNFPLTQVIGSESWIVPYSDDALPPDSSLTVNDYAIVQVDPSMTYPYINIGDLANGASVKLPVIYNRVEVPTGVSPYELSSIFYYNLVSAVPEPSSLLLSTFGGLLLFRRRR